MSVYIYHKQKKLVGNILSMFHCFTVSLHVSLSYLNGNASSVCLFIFSVLVKTVF